MTTHTPNIKLTIGTIPDLWPDPIITPMDLIDVFIENAEMNIWTPDKQWSPIVAEELKRFKQQMIDFNIGDK